MPVTSAQLTAGANYTLMTYNEKDPVDNFSKNRPFAKWLVENKEDSIFGSGIYNEKVTYQDDSNYQNYTGDDQVTYNRKDTVILSPWQHYEAHDGFALNETELANNGIIMTDDKNAVASEAEKIQIVNLLKQDREQLKNGFQRNWDLEVHRDGTQSSKAVPGLDLIVPTDPTTNTVVGGINQSTNTFWQSQKNIAISTGTAGNLIAQMEITHRNCTAVGGEDPTYFMAGSKFIDAYAKDARAQPGTTLMVTAPAKGGVALDGSRTGVFFKGKEIYWDPTLDTLESLLGPSTVPFDKRMYMLNDKRLKLRPVKGRWLVPRTPPRVYDRYTHYFGLTADYGLTSNRRSGMACLSIA